MTKKSQDSSISPQTTGFLGFDPAAMLSAFMPKMNEVSPSGGNPVAVWLEMNQQWTAFLTKRFKKDSALLQQLTTCTSPAELNAAYSDFFKKTVEDYQRELNEMSELGQKALG
ncbi:phasin family protein [Sneathiella sp.]|uniref:phasin family protein n=1 Tax=Sneathiella sp. TaxID=1964365 RepID=UPI0035684474